MIITISGQANTDLTLSAESLTFTPANWDTPQTVSVTANDDDDATPDANVTLSHAAASGDYGSVPAQTVAVTIEEDDAQGITVSAQSLTVPEEGMETYTVVLDSRPTATVTVNTTGHTGTDVTLSDAGLTFIPADWNMPQTVTVTAAHDDDTVPDAVTLVHAASGGDYGGVTAETVVTITDNDAPGVTLSRSAFTMAEESSETYTVTLNSEPSGTVTITFSGQVGTDLTLSPTGLTFTVDNWHTPQTVNVTAADDDDALADAEVTLSHSASGGGYNSVDIPTVAVTIEEDDRTASPSTRPP